MGFSLFEIPIYSFPFPITLYFKKKKKSVEKFATKFINRGLL